MAEISDTSSDLSEDMFRDVEVFTYDDLDHEEPIVRFEEVVKEIAAD